MFLSPSSGGGGGHNRNIYHIHEHFEQLEFCFSWEGGGGFRRKWGPISCKIVGPCTCILVSVQHCNINTYSAHFDPKETLLQRKEKMAASHFN